jgi:hypothetical protein
MGMNSDSSRVNGLSGQVLLNGLGFTAGTGRTQLLAGSATLASWAIDPHAGVGRLVRYASRARWEGRKASLGWLGFGPYCLEN